MGMWQTLALQALVTGITVILVLALFFRWVIKPYVENKLRQAQEMTDSIESRVAEGVRLGVQQGIAEMPPELSESAARDATRQFLRFGTGLFENGLSSFLGNADDLKRRSAPRD